MHGPVLKLKMFHAYLLMIKNNQIVLHKANFKQKIFLTIGIWEKILKRDLFNMIIYNNIILDSLI